MNSTPLTPLKCHQCGATLADDAPEGLCGRCLARLCLARDSVVTSAEAFAAEPPSPEDISPCFPQLEVLACLGRGGMGVVYKARQKSLDRFVALKILAPEREKDPQFADRFAREAQALARLNHPHIVTIYDFGQTDGLFFLLMEFVDGLNLRELLRAGRLEPQAALAIVPPICEALQYAHDRGVVHRDIKPENLLLDKAGQIKIADFGIAKMLDGETLLGSKTQPDKEPCAGTPAYMAPEQSAATESVDHRADIYSLGVVLYEMLTGELPTAQFEIPSRKVQVDVRLDEIVLRALEHEPQLRFQQASHLQTAVETLVNTPQQPGTQRPTPHALSARGDSPKGVLSLSKKTWIPLALASVLLAAAVGFFYQFKNHPIEEAPLPPNPQFVAAANRGLQAFDRADYDQAAAAWDEAIALEPNRAEIHRWRGDASLNQLEFDRALSEYETAIQLDPHNAMAYFCRAKVWTEKEELDKALADLRRAIELKPDLAQTPRYQRSAEKVESLRLRNRTVKFKQAALHGQGAFEKKEFAQAAVDFAEAIRLNPDFSEAHRWLGDAFLNQSKLEMAMSAYEDSIRLDPKNAWAFVSRGMAWTEQRDPDKALADFQRAKELDPEVATTSHYRRYLAAAESLLSHAPNAKLTEAAKGGKAIRTSDAPNPLLQKAPFSAVRWQQAEPEVKVGDEWFKLVSLDGLPASEIVTFSQRTYGRLWRKRFEEDLVDLLTRMDHPPGEAVTLVVQSLTSPETQVLEGVAMTRANRDAIKAAAHAPQNGDQEQPTADAVPTDEPLKP